MKNVVSGIRNETLFGPMMYNKKAVIFKWKHEIVVILDFIFKAMLRLSNKNIYLFSHNR